VKYLITGSFIIMMALFQNCSKVGFNSDSSAMALKIGADGRSAGDDGVLGTRDDVMPGDDGVFGTPDDVFPGDDGVFGTPDDVLRGDDPTKDKEDEDQEDSEDWLYIPGGRGHVPMSSVAICPAGSKDEGKQKCPMFCYQGKDYVMHKSLARDYFAKHFDRVPDYGGGAVPGTCANPDLKLKR
jgi:hypothetical protein